MITLTVIKLNQGNKMRHLKNQRGFIPMMIALIVVLVAIIYLVFRYVQTHH
jgi:hypothetical protein